MSELPTQLRSARSLAMAFHAAVGMGWVLLAFSAVSPGRGLWGLDALGTYPWAVRGAALGVGALLMLPSIALRAHAAILKVDDALGGLDRSRFVLVTLGFAALFGAGLVTLRVATDLHGDGHLIAHGFDKADRGDAEVIVRSAGTIWREARIAPGATLAQYGAGQIARHGFGASSVAGIRVLHGVAGLLMALSVAWLLRRTRMERPLGLWSATLALAATPVALYCGYVENYSLFHWLAFVCLALSWGCVHRRVPVAALLLIFLLTVFVHVQGLVLGPAVLLAVSSRARGFRSGRAWRVFVGVLLLLPFVGVALVAATGLARHLLPLWPREGVYAVLSAGHLTDVLNELLLLFPLLPLLMVAAVAAWRGRHRDTDELHPTEWQLVSVALVPMLLFLLVIDPVLGMPRDWDRFTALQLALAAAMLLALRDLRPALTKAADWRFSPPALGLVLVTTLAWLGVLASEPRTLARFANIQSHDARGAEHLEETLAEVFHDRGEVARAITHVERAYELSGNPRYAVRTAILYEERGQRAEAYRALTTLLDRRPGHHDARFKLVQMLRADENWDTLLGAARAGRRLHPESAIFAFFEGESLLHTGRRVEALEVFRRALSLDLPAPARAFIERTLAEEKR